MMNSRAKQNAPSFQSLKWGGGGGVIVVVLIVLSTVMIETWTEFKKKKNKSQPTVFEIIKKEITPLPPHSPPKSMVNFRAIFPSLKWEVVVLISHFSCLILLHC